MYRSTPKNIPIWNKELKTYIIINEIINEIF